MLYFFPVTDVIPKFHCI